MIAGVSFFVDEALFTAGEKIAEFLFVQWRGDWARRRRYIRAADLVGEAPETSRTRRHREREIGRIADEIADQLNRAFAHEFSSLQDDVPLIASEVGQMFADACLSLDSVLVVDVDPRELAEVLRALRPNATEALSEGGKQLFGLVLTECCEYVVEAVVAMPAFNTVVGQELLRRTTALSNLVQEILEQLPTRRTSLTVDSTQDTLFEQEYRREVARRFDSLELFGLGTPERLRQYPLSVAYISLSMSPPKGASGASTADGSAGSGTYMRVEDALVGGGRYLIRGEAGSGKTTLLCWIAVQAARGMLTGSLRAWNHCVPFVLPLRRYVADELPEPDEFVGTVTSTLSSRSDWTVTKLRLGSALVLIDGLDELPADRRDKVREWLSGLCERFPKAHFVITTRPPAVEGGWLAEDDFAEFELQPMTVDDTRAFIAHWHEAAKKHATANGTRPLDAAEVKLTEEVLGTPHLATLATTPLMCAMLCALNRDRPGGLPRYRTELYRIALEMLLERRDRERNIPSELLPLDLTELRALLQDLAYWLVLESRAQMDKQYALKRVEERLKSLPHVRLDAKRTMEGLLLRTGLLREPVVGAIDFVHKSFQEYFAAAEIVDQDSITEVLRHAESDTWHDVIVLTAGLARVKQREQLVLGLLAQAEASASPRLKLAAVECLGASQQFLPELADQSRQAILSLVPPRNTDEARALAAGREDVPPMLRQYATADEVVAIASARCLGFVGTRDAMTTLAEFARSPTPRLAAVLLEMWGRFDATEYARSVLADLPIEEETLIVRDASLLAPAKHLQHCSKLDCRFAGYLPSREELAVTNAMSAVSAYDAGPLKSLRGLGDQDRLRSIEFHRAHDLIELGPVELAPQLESARIGDAPLLRHIAGFPELATLRLEDAPLVDIVAAAKMLPSLQTLMYSRGSSATSGYLGQARAQATAGDLHQLDVGPGPWAEDDSLASHEDAPPVLNLDGFTHLSKLTTLQLSWISGLVDVEAILRLPGLTNLALRHCPRLQTIEPIVALAQLHTLDLTGCSAIRALPILHARGRMTTLILAGCAALDKLQLDGFSRLEHLSLAGTTVTDLSTLGALPSLEVLDASTSELADLSVLRPLGTLRELALENCRVTTATPLADLNLDVLDIRGCHFADGVAEIRAPKLSVLRVREADALEILQTATLPALKRVEVEGDASELTEIAHRKAVTVVALPRHR